MYVLKNEAQVIYVFGINIAVPEIEDIDKVS